MKKLLIIAIGITIIAQLCVPISLMVSHFDTLKTGVEYRFKVQPVDPYDAFRGRYVAIRVDEGQDKFNYSDKKRAYVTFTTDSDGFSSVGNTYFIKPKNEPYIKAKIKYSRLVLPFERYYMDEDYAFKAETAYRNQRKDAYIKVKVKNGNTVIEGLYIDDMRIEDYVKQKK